jgi:CDP-diacylglycerol--glycerol-3-phosphate 3-phosphatidyltransferase
VAGTGFRITANQVTLARLIPMPFISWWLYQTTDRGLITAIIVGTIIGSTDFVDGYLARKQGPTVLGGLLDPIADKVFVAFCYVPFADMGAVPAWACALMFTREFLVTALRSAYEQRSLSLKTSYLAKVKTWVQMQGIGIMMLFPLIGTKPVMTGIILTGAVAPLVLAAVWWFGRKQLWRGTLIMSGTFFALLLVHQQGDPQLSMRAIMIGVVAMTWISALDYFAIGLRQLRGRGDLSRADVVRVLGALTVPALAFGVLVETGTTPWPIFAVLALELAVGGLDNLLSHHHRASGAAAWGARALGVSSMLAAALLISDHATTLAVLAALVSLVGVTWEFWRGRAYYLGLTSR